MSFFVGDRALNPQPLTIIPQKNEIVNKNDGKYAKNALFSFINVLKYMSVQKTATKKNAKLLLRKNKTIKHQADAGDF